MPKFKLPAVIITLFILVHANTSGQILLPASISDSLHLSAVDSFYYTTGSVSVGVGTKLIIDKNVEVRFAPQARLNVSGTLEIKGDSANMVHFTSTDSTRFWGYINASNALINISGLDIKFATRFINVSHGTVVLKDCNVDKTYGGIGSDCIGVHYADSLYITGCVLNGNPSKPRIDAMDCDDISNGLISNNVIKNFEDDGVDVGTGTSLIKVTGNFIYNCNFGISVGENSNVVAERNVIVKCDAGMQSHSGSTITATNNTLFKNTKGFELHHGSDSNSGGTLILSSSIVAGTYNRLYSELANSSFTAAYCLSDSLDIPGENNLKSKPYFTNPDEYDFTLTAESPCINAADPDLPLDKFGGFADIGAFEYEKSLSAAPLQVDDVAFKLYPNPASDYIVIEANTTALWSCDIISITGELVQTASCNESKLLHDISQLSSGIYLVRIKKESNSTIQKLIVN